MRGTRRRCAPRLSADEYQVFAPRFGLEPRAQLRGQVALARLSVARTIAASTQQQAPRSTRCLMPRAPKLLARRSNRVWPALDDKILVSWNALMIRGMVMAARAFGRDDFEASATRSLEFIRNSMWRNGSTTRDLQGRTRAFECVS